MTDGDDGEVSGGGPLSRRQFEEVMRRAAELAADRPDAEDAGLTDAEVVRIGGEVGLPEPHVRQALAEVRVGRRVVESRRRQRGLSALVGPGTIRTSRTVARPRQRIVRELDEFMVAGQLLQRVRRKDDLLQYRPAIDWASRVARAASSTSRQHYVAAARLVEVRLQEVDAGSTLVELHVDPGVATNYQLGAAFGGAAVGAILGGAAGLGVALLFPLTVAVIAGAAAGTAAALAVATFCGRGFRRRLREVDSEVEGILDALERGGDLEPPPPAWRRWVRRHFHGVAREMMSRERNDRAVGGRETERN